MWAFTVGVFPNSSGFNYVFFKIILWKIYCRGKQWFLVCDANELNKCVSTYFGSVFAAFWNL